MKNDPRQEAERLLEEARAVDAQGDADRAADLLRQSIALQSVNPLAHYLLGADLAERGRNGDAVLHMTTAVEQAPQFGAARLQLGLLWLTLDNPSTAATVVGPLSLLPDTTAMHHFGAAMSWIAAGRPEPACAALRRGLSIGTDNAPLAADMQALLQRLEPSRNSTGHRADLQLGQEADLQTMRLGLAIDAYSGSGPDDR